MNAPGESRDESGDAEALFAEWASRVESGELLDFDPFVQAHPAHADALKELHDDWNLFAPILGRVVPGMITSDSGIVMPSLAGGLDADEGPPTSELLARLGIHAPNEGLYRFRAVLGRGGGGVVLKVWDTKLNRPLAMKVVLGRGEVVPTGHTPRVDGRTLTRFVDEARIAGQLSHPGIAPVHELGADETGRAFFTMKLVSGEDLSAVFDHVRTGAEGWNQTRALGVLLKVCEAMSYAHAKGVIHRDLKPANVMVGKYGEVYVMDWGLARVQGRADTRDLRLQASGTARLSDVEPLHRERREVTGDLPLVTMDGDVVGTPSYMPPEQAAGKLHEVGPHSDVYALGAMLYHLMAGHMPYAPAGTRLDSVAIWRLVQHEGPAPITKLAPRAAAELVAICEKAMARNWRLRYRDMSELAGDLSAYLHHRVVGAYEIGPWAQTKKWVQRNKSLAISLAAGVLALAAGLVVSLSLRQVAVANARLAGERELTATQRANDVLSLSAIQDLAELVARADQLWPVQPSMIAAYEQWLEDARLMIDGRPEDLEHAIKARPSLEQHRSKLIELRSRARPWTDEERRLDRETHPRRAELAAKTAELTWLSRMLGMESWPSEGLVDRTLAMEQLPSAAMDLNNFAWELVARDNRPVYGEEVRACLIARRALAAATAPEYAVCRDTLAWALYERGRLDEALSEDARAVAECAPASRAEFERQNFAKLSRAIDRWRGESSLSARRSEREALAREVERLEREVGARRTYDFEDAQDRWWHAQLAKLVTGLEALRDPKTGLYSDGLSEDHGWGVHRRYEFARSIEEQSISGAGASKRWLETSAAIASSRNYAGLRLSPQLGLLPIGPDPRSGLSEFAHLETGEPAERGADGKLKLTEETGLVFVLLPAGNYFMGAQRDPHGQNFDPGAQDSEAPVHEVPLDAFFLSKYEMTQGQWLRMVGRNPSYYVPSNYGSGLNRENKAWSSLHPVEDVNWKECAELMQRMSLLLPTEAQWEYGCRAGTTSVYWTGNAPDALCEAGNVADAFALLSGTTISASPVGSWNDGNTVHAQVGTYSANAFGLHDVLGNVWEWTSDHWGRYTEATHPGDGSRISSNTDVCMFRGGGYFDSALLARSATRNTAQIEYRNTNLGLRPARRITP